MQREFIRLASTTEAGQSNDICRTPVELFSTQGWMSQQSQAGTEGLKNSWRPVGFQCTLEGPDAGFCPRGKILAAAKECTPRHTWSPRNRIWHHGTCFKGKHPRESSLRRGAGTVCSPSQPSECRQIVVKAAMLHSVKHWFPGSRESLNQK